MNQSNRGTYKKDDNTAQAFLHSTFGKACIALAVLIVLTIIALFTVPSEKAMMAEMTDNIYQCILDNDSIQGDQLDDAVGNVARVFTNADSTAIYQETMQAYHKLNRLEVYRHSLFATAYIYNNLKPQGQRVGFGLFGTVFPTVAYKDLLLRVGPVHRDYGDGTIRSTINYGSDYMGENPDLGPYHEKYD